MKLTSAWAQSSSRLTCSNMAVCSCRQTWSTNSSRFVTFTLFIGLVAANGSGQLTEVGKGMIGLGVAVGTVLLAAAGYYAWRHQRRLRSAGSNDLKLRSHLVADSVAVAKKRNSRLSESSVAAALADIEKELGSQAGRAYSGYGGTRNTVPPAERVPVVTFHLTEEDQKRLRATNVNDSVLLTRSKHRAGSIRCPENHHFVAAYYRQQLDQLGVTSDSGMSSDGALVLPGVPDGSSIDNSNGRHVQFGSAKVVAQAPFECIADEPAAGQGVERGASSRSLKSSASSSSSCRGDDTARLEGQGIQRSKAELHQHDDDGSCNINTSRNFDTH